MPLLARYDLGALAEWPRASLRDREPTLWRYRELLPLLDGESPASLGEGFTPLIHAERLGRELEAIGWIPRGRHPRMISVQAEGCAPIVNAFDRGLDSGVAPERPATIADGLGVPRAVGDFLMLRALRESNGTAVAVSDDAMVDGMRRLGRTEGISAAPEGGATVAALQTLVARGSISREEVVVLFNTGGVLKYLEVL